MGIKVAWLFSEESAEDAAVPAAVAPASADDVTPTKNGAEKEPHVCKICDKTFARSTSLKVSLIPANESSESLSVLAFRITSVVSACYYASKY